MREKLQLVDVISGTSPEFSQPELDCYQSWMIHVIRTQTFPEN